MDKRQSVSSREHFLTNGVAEDREEIAASQDTEKCRSQAALLRYLLPAGLVCSCAALIFRFTYLYHRCAKSNRAITWWLILQASLLLGTEMCLLAMAFLLALIVPPLIITWTTALVFDYIFRHLVDSAITALSRTESEEMEYSARKHTLNKSGMRIAREMLGINAIGAGVVTLCFIATIYMRDYLRSM